MNFKNINYKTSFTDTATGISADELQHLGVPYVYTIELRDTGTYLFLLPADQIIPSGEETTEALIGMFKIMSLVGF